MVAIPYLAQNRGVPAKGTETFTSAHMEVVAGHEPPLNPIEGSVALSQTLSQYHVVGYDASGDLVAATWNASPASAIKPVGVLIDAITTPGSGSKPGTGFWVGGCFDFEKLVWDPTFDTDAKKLAAFNGSPTPTVINLRKKTRGGVR